MPNKRRRVWRVIFTICFTFTLTLFVYRFSYCFIHFFLAHLVLCLESLLILIALNFLSLMLNVFQIAYFIERILANVASLFLYNRIKSDRCEKAN